MHADLLIIADLCRVLMQTYADIDADLLIIVDSNSN